MSSQARRAVDDLIARHGLSLRTKMNTDLRRRYAKIVAKELFDEVRELRAPSLAMARHPPKSMDRLIDVLGWSGDVRAELEQLAKNAKLSGDAHGIATELLKLLITSDEPIPSELRGLAIAALDRARRPTRSGRPSENWLRNRVICTLVAGAKKADPELMYTSGGGRRLSACRVVSERLRLKGILNLSEGTVEDIWKDTRKAATPFG